MPEQSGLERRRQPSAEAHARIDQLIDRYVSENNRARQGWGSADPKPPLKNPDRLRKILYRFADRRATESGDAVPFELQHWIAELAAQETVFQHDFEIIDGSDPRINCAMYALRELGLPTVLSPESPSDEVRKVIEDNFVQVSQRKSGEQLPLEEGELVLIEDGGEDGWHVAIVDKVGEQLMFRSKLGSLFVVRNESIDDLVRLYRGQFLTLYRKR
jgi:hypothetical protein